VTVFFGLFVLEAIITCDDSELESLFLQMGFSSRVDRFASVGASMSMFGNVDVAFGCQVHLCIIIA